MSHFVGRCLSLPILVVGLITVGGAARADHPPAKVRFATFNVSLYGTAAGQVNQRLQGRDDPQLQRLAEILQRVRPDVILINEIDDDAPGEVLRLFCENYLAVGQQTNEAEAAKPIDFPHRRAFETNTGEPSGFDLSRDGHVGGAEGTPGYALDCWGYGVYPGQYGFAVLSRFPIDEQAIRTFRTFAWRDMPGALLPDDSATAEPQDWYSVEALRKFRLSSKNHCDVPVTIGQQTVHLLLSHPTPPVFDGPEDRNGARQNDEVRFWLDYTSVDRKKGGDYMVDDAGVRGSLAKGASFVVMGDLNGDPLDGDGTHLIAEVLKAPQFAADSHPKSPGGAEQAKLQGGRNAQHRGDPALDTCDAADADGPGNLRLDYVLPSADLRVVAAGVFWPAADDPLFALTAGAAHPASSDHRCVWVDVELPAAK